MVGGGKIQTTAPIEINGGVEQGQQVHVVRVAAVGIALGWPGT